MNDTARLAAAFAGGYLLGRTKMGKVAIGLALFTAGRKSGPMGSLPGLVSKSGVGRIAGPLVGPLAVAAQRAAITVVESKVNNLADGLQERTTRLVGGHSRVTKALGGDRTDEAEERRNDSAEDAQRSEDSDEEKQRSAPVRSARKVAKTASRAVSQRAPSRTRASSRAGK
ncbi:hypothetical protein ACFY2R_06350 [Micromonospora olivasterospora]|uniref:Uncharacterized protein n=1 Tax=Micromonospora olivasterospora TaxID=1880 RepID=A0A562IDK7_MICOL|nr:hypothetical protein [Micromonospora olivasterospora]TWH69077.1 hypothetical protein JD77_04079 [Micromonospora olivasterospora]